MPLSTWPKPFRYIKDIRIFLLAISAVITLFVAAIFLFRYLAVNDLLIQTVRQEAESYGNLIILIRHWNAQYGGVYVEKKPGVIDNPYLKELGIEPNLQTKDGRILTLRNPAIMTREISELADKNNMARFHLISLRAINPENSPDTFERDALEQFERGVQGVWKIDKDMEPPMLRSVTPLVVEESCLRCHAKQGYHRGDIRGGISVSIHAEPLLNRIAKNKKRSIIDFFMTTAVLLTLIYFMTWGLAKRLDRIQKKLKQIAVTDELTGIKNRRYIMEQLEKEYYRAARTGEELSLIMIDIDHFKKINDTFGHAFGDIALKTVAHELQDSLRPYDLIGRIGGEEFLIASPGSVHLDAVGLAERIRERIKKKQISDRTFHAKVTVSAGVTSLRPQDTGIDSLLARADQALYQAKQQGRDRVVAM